jgi:hypothetical protein
MDARVVARMRQQARLRRSTVLRSPKPKRRIQSASFSGPTFCARVAKKELELSCSASSISQSLPTPGP